MAASGCSVGSTPTAPKPGALGRIPRRRALWQAPGPPGPSFAVRVTTTAVSLHRQRCPRVQEVRRAVKALSDHPSAEDLHDIRIKVKRTRYAAELVRAAAGERGERFIDQAKTVQDILGEHQDAVILEEYLHETIDSSEATHGLETQLLERQRKRRKKTRAAFFGEWPGLERRGRKVWSAAPTP